MALKPGQLKCIQTLDAPLAVSAGAGSGKTFTLTRRIVNALATGAVDDIGQVLAITYTTKAAAELKSRVRGALRAEGMVDQALKVDAAWISTIHGMCARMLRAHALEVGIDPAFTVIDEARASSLLDEAVEEILSSANEFASPEGLDALFAEFPARTHGSHGGTSVEGMVRSLVLTASSYPEGIAAVRLPEAVSLGELVRRMMGLAEGMVEATLAQKPGKLRDALIEGTRDALSACEEALASGMFANDALSACGEAGAASQSEAGASSIIDLLNAFPVPGRRFGTDDFKDFAEETAQRYKECAAEARYGQAVPLLRDVLQLADKVLAAYRRRKRACGGLDNDDLLVETARAFESCPALAADYANRFRLVMVDEFQDTDQLQVNMVKRLAGPGSVRLCTVGDAQQSIYRFRGADVSVYRRQVASVRAENPDGLICLPDNFRSHADVLAFVDRIFEQPQAFGSSFMSLSASRDESRLPRPFLGLGPRVDVSLITYPYRGVSAGRACDQAARGITLRFAALRAAGHAPGEMVLLLGSTTRADVYACALRREGFPCVVVKGSIFNRAPEVQLMVSLARAAANPLDTLSLFEVLSSEMFALSADDFLVLATCFDDEGKPHRHPLWQGLQERAVEGGASPQLESAMRTVERMARSAGRLPVSAIMQRAVLDSGWLTRLEREDAEGQARAANILKAVRMVEALEAEGVEGPVELARRLALKVELAKEAPGALSAAGGDFVRIMTVHASKGLEFPIVAVAELGDGQARTGKLLTERTADAVYASLDLGNAMSGAKSSSLAARAAEASFGLEEADEDELARTVVASPSAGARRAALCALHREADAQESLRLLYVALTRAKEALVVSLTGKRTKDDPSGASSGVAAHIQSALCGAGGSFPEGRATFDFGGSLPAAFERIDLVADEEPEAGTGESEGSDGGAEAATGGAGGAGEPGSFPDDLFDVFAVEDRRAFFGKPSRFERADVFSYSSLASAAKGGLLAEDAADAQAGGVRTFEAALPREADGGSGTPAPAADDAAWDAIGERLMEDADATDLGTAFHRLAQYAVESRRSGEPFARPDEERVRALCCSCGLGEGQRLRLDRALDRWFSCSLAAQAASFPQVRAEVPFFLALGDRCAPVYLEGEIDLLATGFSLDEPAFVVDYKTGGHADESAARLHEKHELQAKCYALAVLRQGYPSVDLVFVRVEQQGSDALGEPQYVRYAFDGSMLSQLEESISEAYRAARS